MPRVTAAHGYLAIGGASIAMLVQVGIAEGTATKSYQIAHHTKQLVALIPKMACDFACVVLLGPSSRAVASHKFFLGGLAAIMLVHGAKAQATSARYVATGSAESLSSMIQAASCLTIHMIMFFLHRPCRFSAWACYRGCHVLVGASSIFICIHLRLRTPTESAITEFPPLRGSFEGAILAYAIFIALSLWSTSTHRAWVHGALCDIIPWLPLSALRRDELRELLEEEDAPNAAGGPVPLRRRLVSSRMSEHFVSEGGDFFHPVGQDCGASTLGSNSEVADLSSLMQPALPHGPAARRFRVPTPDVSFSPAFYQRQRALECTLHELGITFSSEDEQVELTSSSQSCVSSRSGF